MFTAALFTIAKTWKQTNCPPTNEWTEKMWYINIMEYDPAITKNHTMPFAATWMELETLILSKLEREIQIPYDITYIWNLMHGTNEPFQSKETRGL